MKVLNRLKTLLFTLIFGLTCLFANAQESEQYVWDLTDLYASPNDWEAAYIDLQNRLQSVNRYRGTLGNSAESMAQALTSISNAYKELTRVYIYTSLRRDADQRDPDEQTRFGRAMQLYTDWGEATSWLSPEILSVGSETVHRFLNEEPALENFTFMLEDTLRMAPYTLDEQTEGILAQASLLLASPEQIYQMYANADIPWPTVTLSDGEEAELTQAAYTFYRGVENREDRKLVFDTFWQTWQQYADGMGATLSSEVQANVFSARARSYDSVLQQNLFVDGLPSEIYTQLVTQVNNSLPIFHRYLRLRGRMLGIEDLRYYDIYPPLIEVDTGIFDIERSKEITFEALQPFGEDYLSLLAEGLSQDWMHSHPQAGKTSGAYMSGSAYDVHPYILLNHNDDYNALSTFAHEWGHAVHSLLANANNPWETADYSTFTAEMASTINEILLEEYMIANAQTDEERLFYLGSALESIRGTFFRQTMFAEFELAIHQMAENGEPLNGTVLSETYGELLKRYHGHDEGVLTIDDAYSVEWAYIPHFYYDFYVFQYATSITGAAWFAEKFLAGEVQVRDNFLKVLSAGGSDYPHNILLNEAGLDMTQAEAYEPVIRRMNSLMDRIEAILDQQ
jgi:oligoendopeptidase F